MRDRPWTPEEVKALLRANDKAVWKAVAALHKRQTETEQINKATKTLNGRGFNARDAYILSKYAEYFNRHGRMTPKQTIVARDKIRKYIRQLVEIANEGLNIQVGDPSEKSYTSLAAEAEMNAAIAAMDRLDAERAAASKFARDEALQNNMVQVRRRGRINQM